uniref:CUB domain-containing protein n=2 Tax=Panagrellus redivivus TaxID=6233 RepID=A0A7E4UUX9_PANRE
MVGGFAAEWTFTIDRSNIETKGYFNPYYNNELPEANTNLTDHETIRSGLIIQDFSFTIRCCVHFKIDPQQSRNSVVRPISEDCCIIKFNRKTLHTYKPKQEIIEEMRTLDGITWWMQYYPCGGREEFKDYVSVCFHVHGRAINVTCLCAVSIGGVLIQMTGVATSKEDCGWRKGKCFSHQQCQLVDHNNDVIDIVCKITFETPAQMPNVALPFSLYEDTDTMTVKVDYLDLFEPCQYFQSEKRPIGFKNLMWWLKCYPNGSTVADKGYLSVFVYTNAHQLHSLCKDTTQNGCPKLASHDLIRSSSIIENGAFVIRCKVRFKKFGRTDPEQSSKNNVKQQNKNDVNPIRRDSCIVKLNRNDLDTYKPEESIIIEKQTVDGTIFIIEYYPCGNGELNKGYISVYLSVTGGPREINFSCGMSVNGVLIQLAGVGVYDGIKCWGKAQCFSHKQCRTADHNDDVIDLVCKFHFKKQLIHGSASSPALRDTPEHIPPPNRSADSLNLIETSFDVDMLVNIYRQQHPSEIELVKSLALHLTCLRDYYKHFKRSAYSTSSPDQLSDKNYYFLRCDDTPSPVQYVKDKMVFLVVSSVARRTGFRTKTPEPNEPSRFGFVPCLTYRKAACGKTWYLVFYAPLEWSAQLLDGAVSECGEDDTEVQQRFASYDNLTNHNNLNTAEQGLNNILGYPVSLFPHQNAAGTDHYGTFIKHREAYRTVNIRSQYDHLCQKLIRVAVLLDEPFKSAIFAVQQVIDRKVLPGHNTLEHSLPTVFTAVKQLLIGISNERCLVIYCNRNTALRVGNRQSAVVTVGPIKVIVVVS